MSYVYGRFLKDSVIRIEKFKRNDLITVALGMDLESGWKGSVLKSYKEQNEELLSLAKRKAIVPFLPLHPERAKNKIKRNGDAYDYNELYDTFRDYFKKNVSGFFGVKLYPALGYHPADQVLAPIYYICEKCNIPITVHCGGTIISTFEDEFEINIFGKTETVKKGSRKANAHYLNDPKNWEIVLKEFSKLKVNLAHFGGGETWDKSEKKLDERAQVIVDLMNEYPGVYSDFSFNLNDEKASRIFCNYFRNSSKEYDRLRTRTMHGTDYWVVLPQSNIVADQAFFLDILEDYNDDLLINNPNSFLFEKMGEL